MAGGLWVAMSDDQHQQEEQGAEISLLCSFILCSAIYYSCPAQWPEVGRKASYIELVGHSFRRGRSLMGKIIYKGLPLRYAMRS